LALHDQLFVFADATSLHFGAVRTLGSDVFGMWASATATLALALTGLSVRPCAAPIRPAPLMRARGKGPVVTNTQAERRKATGRHMKELNLMRELPPGEACELAKAKLRDMEAEGLMPNVHAITTAIGLCHVDLPTSEALFARLAEDGSVTEGSYAALVRAQLAQGELDRALETWRRMVDCNIVPRTRNSSPLLIALCAARRQDAAVRLYDALRQCGLEFTEEDYVALLTMHGALGAREQALGVLADLLDTFPRPEELAVAAVLEMFELLERSATAVNGPAVDGESAARPVDEAGAGEGSATDAEAGSGAQQRLSEDHAPAAAVLRSDTTGGLGGNAAGNTAEGLLQGGLGVSTVSMEPCGGDVDGIGVADGGDGGMVGGVGAPAALRVKLGADGRCPCCDAQLELLRLSEAQRADVRAVLLSRAVQRMGPRGADRLIAFGAWLARQVLLYMYNVYMYGCVCIPCCLHARNGSKRRRPADCLWRVARQASDEERFTSTPTKHPVFIYIYMYIYMHVCVCVF